jgi:anti-sigma regulatory factor (Ser/Thr protein kinase)
MILPVPANTPDDFGLTIYKLIQLSEIVNNSTDNLIVVDFSHTKFLHCIYLAGLFSLIKNWRIFGKIVEIRHADSTISEYLNTINFNGGLVLQDCNDYIGTLNDYANKRFTPLIVFPTCGKYREECINTLISVIEQQTGVEGAYKAAINHFITELTNNVADHSESLNGLIIAQTYPNLGYIDIAISDNGIGVLASYNKTDKFHPTSEVDAISMAVNGKSTKDQSVSRGFGLTSSREIIINELEGKFLMWSGSAIFIQPGKAAAILKLPNKAFYNGCFLSLRMSLNGNNNFDLYKYMEK